MNEKNTSRLEAFSDGVMAIIITITVLELHDPVREHVSALFPLIPLFATYALSFETIGTYWNNHHHLFRATKEISTGIMWANLHLLFWLSLIPFATAWLGNNFGAEWPTAFFASILFLCATAYTILVRAILARQGRDSALAEAIGSDIKGNVSLIAYALAIGSAFFAPWLSYALIIVVAVMWFIPDSRLKMFV